MGFDCNLEALQAELSRALLYKRAYDGVMAMRAAAVQPFPLEQLDEMASKLAEAIGVCTTEMHAITGQLQAAYVAAAAEAEAAATVTSAAISPPGG